MDGRASGLQAHTQNPNRPLIRRVEQAERSGSSPQAAPRLIGKGAFRSVPLGAFDARSLGASRPDAYSQPRRVPSRFSRGGKNRRDSRFGGKGRTRRNRKFDNDPSEIEPGDEFDPKLDAYYKEKQLKEEPQPILYQPPEVTVESLLGHGPVIPLGEWGMSDVVHERLASIETKREEWTARVEKLAQQRLEGQYVKCPSEQWRAVKERVKQLEEGNTDASSYTKNDEGKKEGGNALTDEHKARFLSQLLGGEYVMSGKGDSDVLDQVNMLTWRNGSYLPRDGETVAEKVSQLLSPPRVERKMLRHERRGS